ncbi:MAG: (Fe-S)-binding protein [Deltaproteobacteria bacterium]|nr:(Fe-S)-binding protein [Deltaproteobacteria bacterium]
MQTTQAAHHRVSKFNRVTTLTATLDRVSHACIQCNLCSRECGFLQHYGTPKEIAQGFKSSHDRYAMAFQCSLCHLCAAMCPVDVDPAAMFFEIRREAVRRGAGPMPGHRRILEYERRSTSKWYSFYALPNGCDTIFFPGCTLPGTRPDKTWLLFEHIKASLPSLGIVMDCCTKPSHDLGLQEHFTVMFGEMRGYLLGNGIQRVLVACPSCYKIFKAYGDGLAVESVYEFLAGDGLPVPRRLSGTVAVHDPCGVRHEKAVHRAVRHLCERQGLAVQEMDHHGTRTLCCGEGGSVGYVAREYAQRWAALRRSESNGARLMTYCAGCAHHLGATAAHVVDLLFEPEATMAGKVKVSRAPVTYLNRLRLKRRFRKAVKGAITRERPYISRALRNLRPAGGSSSRKAI